MTSFLRTITLCTAIALLIFVGLHAVVPHDHPHAEGYHWSELPPMAHAENKIFFMVFVALGIMFASIVILPSLPHVRETVCALDRLRSAHAFRTFAPRYREALRRGRIHSKAY